MQNLKSYYQFIPFLCLIFFSCIFLSQSQEQTTVKTVEMPAAPNATDSAGLKQGEWIYTFDIVGEETADSSQIAYYRIVDYKDGKPVGTAAEFYITGEKRAEMTIISERPITFDGKHTSYHRNGQVKSVEHYDKGKLTGQNEYYYPDGSVDSASHFNQDVNLLLNQNAYKQAIPIIRRILEIRKEKSGIDNIDYIRSLKDLGYVLVVVGEFGEAEEVLLNYKELAGKNFGKKSSVYSAALYYLSGVYSRTNQFEKAIDCSLEDLEITKEKNGEESKTYIQGSIQLATIYKQTAKYDEAGKVLLRIKKILEEVGDTSSVSYSQTIFYLAGIYRQAGKYGEALEYYEKDMVLSKALHGEESLDYANLLSSMGHLYTLMGHYDNTLKLIERSMVIKEKIFGPDNIALASPYYGKGIVLQKMGRYSEAEVALLKSIEIFNKTYGENNPNACNLVNELSILYRLTGRYDESELYAKKAIGFCRAIYGEAHPNYAGHLQNLANIYVSMGRYDEAIDLFDRSNNIKIEVLGENHPDVTNGYHGLANAYAAKNDYEEAIKLEEKALAILDKNPDVKNGNRPVYLNSLGNFYRSKKDYAKADSILAVCLNITEGSFKEDPRLYSAVLSSSAYIKMELENYDEAGKSFRKALDIVEGSLGKHHPNYTNSLINMGGIYFRTGDFDRAEPYLKNGVNAALKLTERFFPSLSETEKIQYWNSLSKHLEYFNNFVVFHHEKNPEILGDMYDYSLHTKGMILEAKKKSLQRARNMSKILRNWQSTREYWMKLVQNPDMAKKMGVDIDSVENAANEYERMMSEGSSGLKAAFDTTKVRWYDIQKALKEGEAAVEIIRFKTHDRKNYTGGVTYAALIVKGGSDDGIEFALLENGKELEKKHLENYLEFINKHKRSKNLSDSEKEKLKELYDEFWGKISEKIKGAKSVYVSPDGVFHKINLQTLVNPETGKYLHEELDIILLTSTRDASGSKNNSMMSKLLSNDSTAVLFGAPDFNLREIQESDKVKGELIASSMDRSLESIKRMGSISQLPGTAKEVRIIEEKLKAMNWETEVYTGPNALESKIKLLSGPKILHIATHGVFLEDLEMGEEGKSKFVENPMLRSMLLFAGAGKTVSTAKDSLGREVKAEKDIWAEDGILTAYEVTTLDLDGTEFVVLSACNTAKGEVKNGEGVFGLQRAFQVAGAKTIIMSLWAVDDVATQELMTLFYEKLLSGKSKKQAFRLAQSEIMEKYKSPYYWGAFVMVGE